MTLLDRYIVRSILGFVLLVMVVVLILGALFVFIDQQDDIGVGHYTVVEALWYTLLNLPQQAYELLVPNCVRLITSERSALSRNQHEGSGNLCEGLLGQAEGGQDHREPDSFSAGLCQGKKFQCSGRMGDRRRGL